MTLDDIKPNTTYSLTQGMDLLFRAANCAPRCHGCYEQIRLGDKFELATHEDNDVMLCDLCEVADLIRRERERQRKLRGGFSRPTKGGGDRPADCEAGYAG